MTTWTEPRGPHLPDQIARIPPMARVFVVAAVIVTLLRVVEVSWPGRDVPALVLSLVALVSPAAFVLLGAALFYRRPDAWARLRPIAMAVTLFAAGELLSAAARLTGDIDASSGFAADGASPVTIRLLVEMGAGVARMLALGYLWAGVGSARRRDDAPRTRAISLAIFSGAVIGAVLELNWLVGNGVFAGEMTFRILNAVSLVISGLTLLAAAALTSDLLAGVRSGEAPARAWRLGLGGIVCWAIAWYVVDWLFVWFTAQTADALWPIWVIELGGAAASVLLLAAVHAGLGDPADEPLDATADGPVGAGLPVT